MSKTVRAKKVNPFFISNPLKEDSYIPFLANMAAVDPTPFGDKVIADVLAKRVPDLTVKPSDYDTPHAYLRDAQKAAYFSKNPHFTCGIDTEAAAIKAFLNAEEQCRNTNISIRKSEQGGRSTPLWQVLYTARHYALMILGDCKIGKPRFGPGSTVALKGKQANLISKLGTLPEVSPSAHDFVFRNLLDLMPHYMISCGVVERTRYDVRLTTRSLPLVNHNVFRTVPKNFKTDRPICIEPMGNMLMQLAMGDSIRTKLRNFGLDLNSRPEHHAVLAKQASIDGSLATIDLASASDTVSRELVRFLLPPDWFDVLNSLRAKFTLMPNGTRIMNHKFSSMGNGYTFELESLIFYCILLAVRKVFGKKDMVISVFGDDIICDTSISYLVIAALEGCGFSINTDKTFTSGPFRESCGNDYYRGCPVRPIYFKDCYDRKPIETLFYMANRISEVACSSFAGVSRDPLYSKFRKNILKRIPRYFQYYGPSNYGDTCINDGWHPGCYFLASKPARIRLPEEPNYRLTCALAGIESSGTSYRGAEYKLRKKPLISSATSTWIPQ